MYYLGPAVLKLTYSTQDGETSLTCTGGTVTLFKELSGKWTVMFDDPTNQVPLDGLVRAVVTLPHGEVIAGAAQRGEILGACFGLIEDGEQ